MLRYSQMLLKSFGGNQLDTVGKCLLDTKVKEAKVSTPLEFYVLRDNVRPLLGLESYLNGTTHLLRECMLHIFSYSTAGEHRLVSQ